jgi:hypothetical protein
MALIRRNTVFTYSSFVGTTEYYFDVTYDGQGGFSVSNIRSSSGAMNPLTPIPESVMNDILSAKDTVKQIVGETVVASGSLTFTGQSELVVTFASGTLNNSAYRVYFTTTDGTEFIADSKTADGFIAATANPYGSVASPKTVGYVVYTTSQQISTSGGVLTFDTSASIVTVYLSPAFQTDTYRVLTSPVGFFSSYVTEQTRAYFKVGITVDDSIGASIGAGPPYYVGYDIIVG